MKEKTFAVTTASQKVLESTGTGAKRKYLALINDSDTVIYVSFSTFGAVANSGFRLNANGGSVIFDEPDTVPNEAIYAIHGGSNTKTLLINVI